MNSKMEAKTLFDRLKVGIEEGIKHIRGEIKLKTTDVPARPPQVDKDDVIALRHRLDLTPQAFARLMNVPTATVKLWEKGERKPSRSALRLIQIWIEMPELTMQIMNGNSSGAIKK